MFLDWGVEAIGKLFLIASMSERGKGFSESRTPLPRFNQAAGRVYI